jgi:hypothetical protein
MPTVNAKFTADFDSFFAAVQRADYELKLFSSQTSTTGDALGSMVDRFSGIRIIEQATLMTRAIDEVGGVSQLTAKELAEVGRVANEAVDKIKAIGGTPPADMLKLADATKAAAGGTDLWSGALKTATGFLGALGIQTSLQGVINFGKEILDTADATVKMAQQTGMTVDEVQRLQAVSDQTSVPMARLTAAVQTLEEKLGKEGANSGAAAALRRLGIGYAEFMQATPYDQLLMISDGFQGVTSETDRAAIGTALFGKNWRQIIPALLADMRDIADTAPVMSDATIKAYDDMHASVKRFWTDTVVLTGESVGTILKFLGTLGAQFNENMRNVRAAIGTATPDDLKKLQDATRAASDEAYGFGEAWKASGATEQAFTVRQNAIAMKEFREQGVQPLTLSLTDTAAAEQALTKSALASIDANKEHKKATDAAAKAQADFRDAMKAAADFAKPMADQLDSINGAVVAGAIALNENGMRWDQIRVLYGLTAGQMKAVEQAAKDQAKAVSDSAKAAADAAKAEQQHAEALQTAEYLARPLVDRLGELDTATVDAAKAALAHGLNLKDVAAAYGLSADAARSVQEAYKAGIDQQKEYDKWVKDTAADAEKAYKAWSDAQDKTIKTTNDYYDKTTALHETAMQKIDREWANAYLSLPDQLEVGSALWQKAVDAIDAYYSASLEDMKNKTKGFGDYLSTTMPKAILSAFQGGGDVGKTIGATIGTGLTTAETTIGKTITDNVSKLPGLLGSSLGTIVGPLGTLAGGFVGDLIGKMFGSNPEKEVNKVRQAFVDASGGLDQLNRKAFDAGMTLNDLLGAKNMDQYTAAVDKLNAAFGAKDQLDTARDGYIAIAGGIDALTEHAYTAGTSLDAMLNAKSVDDYNAAMQGLSDAFAFQDQALSDVVSTASKYGITLEQLGPALQKQELDKQAQQLFKDFETLNAAGIDTQVIATGMADSINEYVNRALRMGTEIPIAMKPMLEDMVRTGQLVDENGNAITSLEDSGVSFAMTMSQGFQAMIDSVEKLTTVISRSLGVALDTTRQQLTTMPRSLSVDVQYNDPGFRAPAVNLDALDVPGYQEGTKGRFVDFGRGSLVMLHEKEAVVPQGEALQAIGAAPVEAGGANVSIVIQAQGAFFDTPGDLQRLADKVNAALTQKYGTTTRMRAA